MRTSIPMGSVATDTDAPETSSEENEMFSMGLSNMGGPGLCRASLKSAVGRILSGRAEAQW